MYLDTLKRVVKFSPYADRSFQFVSEQHGCFLARFFVDVHSKNCFNYQHYYQYYYHRHYYRRWRSLQLKVILIKIGPSLAFQLVAETIILFRTTSVYFIYHKNGLKVYWCYWNSTCKETSILVNLLRPIGPRLSMIEKNSNFVNMGYKC